jgi:3-phosphoglycerate kinase
MFTKQTIRDVDLRGKTVLLRAELDAPLSADGSKVMSDFRLQSNLPTIEALLEKDCKIIIIGKLGRPDGKPDLKLSLFPVAARLERLLKHDITFVPDCVGEKVQKAAAKLEPGHILLLENLFFHSGELQNDEDFARSLAADTGAEVFVQDCFASAHRNQASMVAITHCLPSVAGLSFVREMSTLTKVVEDPVKPLMAVIGGAKIADKLEVMQRFIEVADIVAVGGAMANTFLAANGVDIGDS